MAAESVSLPRISIQRFGRAQMHGYLPRLVEFAATNDDQLVGQLNVLPVQADGFAEAHSSDCQQPD